MRITEMLSGCLIGAINKLVTKDSDEVNFQHNMGRMRLYVNVYSGNRKYDLQQQTTWHAIKMILHNRKKILANDIMFDVDTQKLLFGTLLNNIIGYYILFLGH